MKQIAQFGLFGWFCVCAALTWGDSHSAAGKWRTIDDATGEAKSIVELSESGGEVTGKVLEILTEPDGGKSRICDLCKGERKDQPVLGMVFLWDMQADGKGWSGGRILDPKNGKEYKCKMKLVKNGQVLEVRGFIGFSLLGRTQRWERME